MFPGGWEWVIVLGIVILLFGGKRIPKAMRSLGTSIVEFKKGLKGVEDKPQKPDSE